MRTFLFLMVFAAGAAAQVVSPRTARNSEGPSFEDVPFLLGRPLRYQQIHADLPPGPLSISRIAFRVDTPTFIVQYIGTRTMVIDLILGVGPASHAAVSRVYANNISGGVTVLSNQTVNWGPQGTASFSPSPQPFSSRTAFFFPTYVWPPNSPSLTWEVVIHSQVSGGGNFGRLDADRGSVTWASRTTEGPGCLCTGRSLASRLESFMADTAGQLGIEIGVGEGPSDATVLLAIGMSNPKLPFPGLCGNILTDFMVPPFPIGTTNAIGSLASPVGFSLSLPNRFASRRLFFQAYGLDTGRSGLPICNSSGVSHTVPSSNFSRVPLVSRMYDSSNTTTATTGAFHADSTVGYGLPVQFD